MSSPALDTPARSLEQLRDELYAELAALNGTVGDFTFQHALDAAGINKRIRNVEREIAIRNHRDAAAFL